MSQAARKTAAVGILAAAGMLSLGDQGSTPPGDLNLDGTFASPADAAVVAALCRELADEIEHDGKSATPYLKAGVHFDTLRTRAREMRCRGRQLGDANPEARDRIAAFLDKVVGNSGGPVDAAGRAAWVKAYRAIGDAADAAR